MSDISVNERSKCHTEARRLAALGVKVFACEVNGKKPAPCCPHGFKDATTDPATIDRWWSEADYNIGMCPHDVGLCVVDLDGQEGLDNWRALIKDRPVRTRTTRTPHGFHLYFKGDLPPTASKIAPKIDTRGRGSYVLLPPSVIDGIEYKTQVEAEPPALPQWIADKCRIKIDRAAAAVEEIDAPANVERAQALLARYIKTGDVAIEGKGGNTRTYRLACELLNLGLGAEKAQELLEAPGGWNAACVPPWDSTELETLFKNAESYAQNEAGAWGVRPAAETFTAETLERLKAASAEAKDDGAAEIDAAMAAQRAEADYFARFTPGAGAQDTEDEPTDLADYLTGATPPPVEMLVPDWIERGIYTALSGPGGTHKSRLLLQLALCLVYRRPVFHPLLDDGDAPHVDHVEYLSCENSKAETRRRIAAMNAKLYLVKSKSGDVHPTYATMKIWELRKSRRALMTVDDRDPEKVTLTPFGKKMLRRWERFAAEGKHTLVILDSLFNAVSFQGNAKNIDACARAVVERLDHWCDLLNLTILAPFHPSRAGITRGDIGFSSEFENAPRALLEIKSLVPKTRGASVPAGRFTLSVKKRNDGPQGHSINLYFDAGVLLPDDTAPAASGGTGRPLHEAAAYVALWQAYGVDDADRIMQGGLSTEERETIKLRNEDRERLRSNGRIGAGRAITNDSQLVRIFRERTNNPTLKAGDLLRSCEDATRCDPPLLHYQGGTRNGARSGERAGYCMAPSELEALTAPADDDEEPEAEAAE